MSVISRRELLKYAGLAAAFGIPGCRPTRSKYVAKPGDESIPVVIIGSGFGGSVTALRLAEAGVESVVLERGRRWTLTDQQDTFAPNAAPDARSFWLNDKANDRDGRPLPRYVGVYERRGDDNMQVAAGAGVGGGSLVYLNMTILPRRESFQRVFPKALDYDEMVEKHYARAQSMLQASPIPKDILDTPYYANARALRAQAERAGQPHSMMNLAIDWDVVRDEIAGRRKPSLILGDVRYGCNSGAKRSVDRTYLAKAEATGHTRVLPLHRVMAISEVPDHGFRLSCEEIDDSGAVVRTKSIVCEHLFLAAGSLGTSELLVRAKAEGTLPRLNDQIGRDWGTNGNHQVVRSSHEAITNPWHGAPAGCRVDFPDTPYGSGAIESIPAPSLADAKSEVKQGSVFVMGLAVPGRLGLIAYDPKTRGIKIDWPYSDPANLRMIELVKHMHRVLDEANKLPPAAMYRPPPMHRTAHPLGGAVIGRATDMYGRVHGYNGLYVVDGALIPGTCGVANPSLTITALAERAAEALVPAIVSRREAATARG